MPVAWYIVPYGRRPGSRPVRYPAIDDYSSQIHQYGGQWAETEILGNRCIVKVRAPQAVLSALDGVYKRLPKDRLDDVLADLPLAVRRALRDELADMGYALDEIRARFGDDLGAYTLRDVLRFAATRRFKPRYDAATDSIILDGSEQSCRSVESVDVEVQ
jgi:hypothetical protein